MGWQSLLVGNDSRQRPSSLVVNFGKAAFVLFAGCLLIQPQAVSAQGIQNSKRDQQDKFRQLEEILPTANVYRTASGAPGHNTGNKKLTTKLT